MTSMLVHPVPTWLTHSFACLLILAPRVLPGPCQCVERHRHTHTPWNIMIGPGNHRQLVHSPTPAPMSLPTPTTHDSWVCLRQALSFQLPPNNWQKWVSVVFSLSHSFSCPSLTLCVCDRGGVIHDKHHLHHLVPATRHITLEQRIPCCKISRACLKKHNSHREQARTLFLQTLSTRG